MGRVAGVIKAFLVSVVIGGMTIWASLAIYYSNLPGRHFRSTVACLFILATLVCFLSLPRRGRTLLGFIVGFLLIVAWWTTIPASNNRDWQADVAVPPHATIQDKLVTIHNIRNFNYRTETDFDVYYYDKIFDLNTLESVDLSAVYWIGDAIAHIIISFSFQEKDYIAFSIETRKEKGEGYSAIKGFFKQYELIYIAGDVRDLIRVRTDYRNPQEDVYLYRTKVTRERARKLFMEYVRQINAMKERPVWYNTLTTNCTQIL